MPKPFQTKFIAAFLILFVCMNAGGAVCAAYCRSVVLNAADSHCPLPKKESHRDKSQPVEDTGTALAATKFDCCPMIVSFIPGTLEPKPNISAAATAIPAPKIPSASFVELNRHQFLNIRAYRGPPKDGSVLHITNRVLRI